MKTVAIIQARMGASRLPGKVLSKLGGEPVLFWVTRAARSVFGIDDVWIATSDSAADDAVANWATKHNISVHRGSEHDVLDRFAGAANASKADIVVRLTADCPFLDPQVIATNRAFARRHGRRLMPPTSIPQPGRTGSIAKC